MGRGIYYFLFLGFCCSLLGSEFLGPSSVVKHLIRREKSVQMERIEIAPFHHRCSLSHTVFLAPFFDAGASISGSYITKKLDTNCHIRNVSGRVALKKMAHKHYLNNFVLEFHGSHLLEAFLRKDLLVSPFYGWGVLLGGECELPSPLSSSIGINMTWDWGIFLNRFSRDFKVIGFGSELLFRRHIQKNLLLKMSGKYCPKFRKLKIELQWAPNKRYKFGIFANTIWNRREKPSRNLGIEFVFNFPFKEATPPIAAPLLTFAEDRENFFAHPLIFFDAPIKTKCYLLDYLYLAKLGSDFKFLINGGFSLLEILIKNGIIKREKVF